MNKKRFLMLVAVCLLLGYMFIRTDGESIIRHTNLREMDRISILYSRDIGAPNMDMTLDTRQRMELADMISDMELRRFFKDYFYTDGPQSIRISAKDSNVGGGSVISFHGSDCMTVYFTNGRYARYRILNYRDFDTVGYIEKLFELKFREGSLMPNFTVTTAFPEGWTFIKRPADHNSFGSKYIMSGLSYVHDIYDENGSHIGAIGCSKYEITDMRVNSPQSIYVSIGLANDYHFSTYPPNQDGYYETVSTYEYGTSATTKVYYIPHFAKDAGYPEKEKYNDGILCYNNDLQIFVAMEFEEGVLSRQELESLAESTKILLNNERAVAVEYVE